MKQSAAGSMHAVRGADVEAVRQDRGKASRERPGQPGRIDVHAHAGG